MALNIPQKEIPKIKQLYMLLDGPFSELIEYLNNYNVIKKIPTNSKTYNIDSTDLHILVDAAVTLYRVREISGVKHDEFIDDLIEAIRTSAGDESTSNQKYLDGIKNKLQKLLNIKNIKQQIKAERLQRDGERIYVRSKVLSDIRPVFEKEPTERPQGAVITHTLKLNSFSPNKTSEFHVVLDLEDLKELNQVIERAILKDKTLRSLLNETKLDEYGS